MSLAIERPKFALFHLNDAAAWSEVGEYLRKHFVYPRDFFNKINYFDGFVKSVLVERDYICKDYRDSYHNFYSKKFTRYGDKCVRLHFFNTFIDKDKIWSLDDSYQANYVGYLVLRPTIPFCIGRVLLNASFVNTGNAAMVSCKTEVNVLGSRFFIQAFPFMGQDTDVTVCAHAAIWMILRCFSTRYTYYREVYPFQIAKMTSDVSWGRILPSNGLTIAQISEIFSNYGMYPDIYMRQNTQDFERLLYYYIESGIPLVAQVGPNHAVSIFGHVGELDYSAVKEYDHNGFIYYNSADLIKGVIANDDNHLPYYSLLRNKVAGKNISSFTVADIVAIVIPLYEKIFLAADAIEPLFKNILSHDQFGFNKCAKRHNGEKLIVRPYLTTSRSYKKFRRSMPVYAGIEKLYLEMSMPKFIWVVELSTLDKYKNKKIIGEILFDSSANKRDMLPFLSIHYPGFLLINDRSQRGSKISTFSVDDTKITDYDMYISNLGGTT